MPYKTDITVTALMCTCNGRSRGFLDEAIRSVEQQTRPADEFLIVDDGSTDGTGEYIQEAYPQVRLLRTENKGLPAARNAGFRNAAGSLVAFIDDDDVWLPTRIEKTLQPYVQYGKDFLNTTIVFSSCCMLDMQTKSKTLVESKDYYRSWPACLLGPVVNGNGGLMLPVSVFRKIGAFNEQLSIGEDRDYWHRALRAGITFCYEPDPQFIYRRHSAEMSFGERDYDRKIFSFVKTQAAQDEKLQPALILLYHACAGMTRSLGRAQAANSLFFFKEVLKNSSWTGLALIALWLRSLLFAVSQDAKEKIRKKEVAFICRNALKKG